MYDTIKSSTNRKERLEYKMEVPTATNRRQTWTQTAEMESSSLI